MFGRPGLVVGCGLNFSMRGAPVVAVPRVFAAGGGVGLYHPLLARWAAHPPGHLKGKAG